jgi:hypothetical protein
MSTENLSPELVLYMIPSPYGIRWSSPRALARSAMVNGVSSLVLGHVHSIGHAHIGLRTANRHILTGMTVGSTRKRGLTVLKQQMGLGILFHRFEGRLEPRSEVEQSIEAAAKTNRLSRLRFLLNGETADRLINYFDEYERHKHRLGYGFLCRPRHKEGAGCTEFAISFLEIAGLLSQEFQKSWRNSCIVPSTLIGEPARPVPLRTLLWSQQGKRWAPTYSEGRQLEFWDPDRMHQWVMNRWRQKDGGLRMAPQWQIEKESSVPGLIFDAREWPVSKEPIWKVS